MTITGTNFAAGATVTFGGAAASNVVVISATQISATTPAGSAGAVTVTVTVNGQSGSLANGFTYVVPPTVTSVSPNSGTTAGGTAVTIAGANFVTGATVTFGGAAASNVVVVSRTQITATTPVWQRGSGDRNGDESRITGWESDEWIHLCDRCANGDQCFAEQWTGSGRNGGDDHGDELCGRRDGEIWKRGGQQRGSGEWDADHSDDTGWECGSGDGNGHAEWPKRKSGEWVYL